MGSLALNAGEKKKKKKRVYCVDVPEKWFCLVLGKRLFTSHPNPGFQRFFFFYLGYKNFGFNHSTTWGFPNEEHMGKKRKEK